MAFKVIENWKRAHKFGSIWWAIAGVIAMLLEIFNNTWFSLPKDIQDKIPNAPLVSLLMFIAIIISRVIVWVRPEKEDDGSK
ncbi:putative holin [Erwinia phage phiEaP8]|nr:holin [Erwinia phage phiEaP8]AWN06198.1 putative holin [Erwinia phage phiEaP8]